MFMRSMLKAVTLVAAFGLVTGSAALQAASVKKAHNMVVQVVDNAPDRWAQTLSIVKNLKNDMGTDNLEIEIVAHGAGLKMIHMESELAKKVAEVQKQGVAFSACAASMKGQKLTEKDLLDGVKVVPFGAKRIMERQEQGWSYLRM